MIVASHVRQRLLAMAPMWGHLDAFNPPLIIIIIIIIIIMIIIISIFIIFNFF